MRSKLPHLAVGRIIVHDVPRRLKAGEASAPTYSEVESPLDGHAGAELRVFFRKKKILDCINSGGALDVVLDPETTSPVPGLVSNWLQGTSPDFVAMSKSIAEHLHRSQPGASPAGLVVVMDCPMAALPAVAIMKLERDEGARLEHHTIGGRPTYNIERIRNLMLTEKTKVFKLALFAGNGSGGVVGLVVDQQRSYFEPHEVATYFLRDFLGCSMLHDPAMSTKQFSDAVQSYLNTSIADGGSRSELMLHLLSELKTPTPTVDPTNFASRYIPPNSRQDFVNHLHEAGVGDEPFPKDTAQISGHLSRLVYQFSNGIIVIATEDAMNKNISVSNDDEGKTKMEIVDNLQEVRTRK